VRGHRFGVIEHTLAWRIANQQLGYPLYIIPLIGVTHILGGVGLLIPNVPRLTEGVYAGIAINLLFAFYSQPNGDLPLKTSLSQKAGQTSRSNA
jgi:uncharacterized membrane protein YphA (DoxX/SURF4 family)